MKRLAGIDFGLKRVGFALSDPFQITVKPVNTFQNDDKFRDEIINTLSKYDIEKIIIGKPNLTNNNEKLLEEIDKFKEFLEKDHSYNCEFIDESYTSKRAMDQMIASGKKKKYRREKSNLDSIAAAIILNDYLEENK